MSTKKGSELALEVMEQFLIPIAINELHPEATELCQRLPPTYVPLSEAFNHSLSAVIETICVPVNLASAAAEGSHWQRISTAE